jgi:hypothetical protein
MMRKTTTATTTTATPTKLVKKHQILAAQQPTHGWSRCLATGTTAWPPLAVGYDCSSSAIWRAVLWPAMPGRKYVDAQSVLACQWWRSGAGPVGEVSGVGMGRWCWCKRTLVKSKERAGAETTQRDNSARTTQQQYHHDHHHHHYHHHPAAATTARTSPKSQR